MDIGELINLARRINDLVDDVDDLDPAKTGGSARGFYRSAKSTGTVAAGRYRIGDKDVVVLVGYVPRRYQDTEGADAPAG
jgi:hypothetical protein